MACPFFYPVARFETDTWAVLPRLPLGDPYSGECRASDASFQPDENHLRQVCNLGYGRSRCDRFPETSANDAVRFNLGPESGELIRIQFVFEKECWPKEHGIFEWRGSSGNLTGESEDHILRRQAAAFVESYLRRKG
ncbi:MAG TPA: hypothetical protein VKT81_27550 [Bryobacteraceae bacterium]|nr:hypothetical protein [Bryobacteraceae bacterium]